MTRWITRSLTLTMSFFLLSGCSQNKQLALKEFPRAPKAPEVPAQRFEAIDPALTQQAREQLHAGFASTDPHVRANAIESAQNTLGAAGAHNLVAAALADEDPNVRFAGCMAVGKLELHDLHDTVAGLADDSITKVRVGVRFALHKLGDTSRSHDLEKFATSPSPRVREDVAFVVGELGEKSGAKVLNQMLLTENDDGVRIQIAESRWKLGDEEALEPLVRGLVSNFVDDQMWSLTALTSPKDRRVEGYVRGKLTDSYAEIALVAARCMGDLGYDAGYPVAMKFIKSPDARQRYLAAIALGTIGRSDAQTALAPLLKDREPRVRVAAATALLQLKEPSGPNGDAITQTP